MTDRVTGRRAHIQLYLSVLVTDGAGQAGFEVAFPVRVGIVHTLLTHCVMIVLTVSQYALSHRAQCAGLATAQHRAEEVVVVADTDGIIGVSAGSLQPHQAGALSARSALLCEAIVLREGLTCRWEDRSKRWHRKAGGRKGKVETTKLRRLANGDSRKYEEITRDLNSESNGIIHVYCTFIRAEDTLIHWVLSELRDKKGALVEERIKSPLCSLRYRSWCVCAVLSKLL